MNQTPSSRVSARTIAAGVGLGCLLAVVANLLLFLIGNVGAPTQIVETTGEPAVNLTIGRMVLVTVFPMILAGFVLWFLTRRRPSGFAIWAGFVLAIAFVTTGGPLSLDVDSGSKITLSLMHLATGITTVSGQRLARSKL
jgi:hypothetical protein